MAAGATRRTLTGSDRFCQKAFEAGARDKRRNLVNARDPSTTHRYIPSGKVFLRFDKVLPKGIPCPKVGSGYLTAEATGIIICVSDHIPDSAPTR